MNSARMFKIYEYIRMFKMTKRCYYGFVPKVYVKQINVTLWLQILCLMKRYVDVKKCYKNTHIIL